MKSLYITDVKLLTRSTTDFSGSHVSTSLELEMDDGSTFEITFTHSKESGLTERKIRKQTVSRKKSLGWAKEQLKDRERREAREDRKEAEAAC